MQFKKLSIRTLNQHSKRSLNKVLYIHTYISYQLSADVKVGFFLRLPSRVHSAEKNNPVNCFSRGAETMSCWVKTKLTNHFQNNLICFEDSL